ncbi:MAG: hypothetical protein DRP08_01055 [Candidatus Aenigmatarchaeota archaeon]|nr:MAG: hypothetical protein DRP08_01055 [Candidatus Aenigmarchaeota archaeon]
MRDYAKDRTRKVCFRVSKKEYQEMLALMIEVGCDSISDYIRKHIINGGKTNQKGCSESL